MKMYTLSENSFSSKQWFYKIKKVDEIVISNTFYHVKYVSDSPG